MSGHLQNLTERPWWTFSGCSILTTNMPATGCDLQRIALTYQMTGLSFCIQSAGVGRHASAPAAKNGLGRPHLQGARRLSRPQSIGSLLSFTCVHVHAYDSRDAHHISLSLSLFLSLSPPLQYIYISYMCPPPRTLVLVPFSDDKSRI